MAVYSITDLAKLSGVKAPTLRVWEQRYALLRPKRTASNVRYYDDEDLRHLLNVALLNRNGLRISQIAKLEQPEIVRRVAELSAVSDEYSTQLDALTLSMLEMDEERFGHILALNIEQIGFERAMITVMLPFLDKLSVLWVSGSVKPVQEAFTSGLLRRKLMVAIEQLPHPPADAPRLVLFLPEGETQEVSLLLLHYLARSRGQRVYHLGREVSIRDLRDAAEIVHPTYVFTMLNETQAHGTAAAYAEEVAAACPDAIVLLSGYQPVAQRVKASERVIVLASMRETLDFLEHATRRDA